MTPDTIKRHIADWRERERQSLTNYGKAEMRGAITALQDLLAKAEKPAPGDDEIVEAMWDAYSAVRDKDLHASCRPAMTAALAAARSMIEGQTAQAAPASTITVPEAAVIIEAYGDQRAREALKRAATLARDDDGKFSWSGEDRNAVLLQKCCSEISDAILKLIPKGPAND
jgi:hypothetical protein